MTGNKTTKLHPSDRWLIALSAAAGVALLVIGIRFATVPNHAGRFFGLAPVPGPFDLHHVVALRDIWIALLVIGLAALREWRALSLCLGLGALVCLGDSVIVARSSGSVSAMIFHVASGLYCGGVALALWKHASRS